MLSALASYEQRNMKSLACLVCWTVRHLFIVHAEEKGWHWRFSGFFAAVVVVIVHSWL